MLLHDHPRETERLSALRLYEPGDAAPDPSFDNLARLAAFSCATPMAAVTLVGHDTLWYLSAIGIDDADPVPRQAAFSSHTILAGDLFTVGDADADPRFENHPLVQRPNPVRFYAGVPLTDPQELPIGALCVFDTINRSLTDDQRQGLKLLASQVMTQLELRRQLRAEETRRRRHQESERRLRASEAQYVSAVNSMQEGLLICDTTGAIKICNQAAEEMLGMGAEQLLSRRQALPIWRLRREDGSEYPIEEHPIARALRDKEAVTRAVACMTRPDGKLVWLSINAAPIVHGDDPRPTGAVTILRDVTERRRADAELREAYRMMQEKERFLATVIDELPHAIACRDIGNGLRYTLWNKRCEVLYGLTRDQVIGKELSDIFPADKAERLLEASSSAIATGTPQEAPEEHIASPELGDRWVKLRYIPVRDVFGTVYSLIGIGEDITDAKRAQEAMAHLAAIVEASEDMIISVDLEGRVQSWNAGAERILGYREDEIVGRPSTVYVPKAERRARKAAIDAVRRGKQVPPQEVVRTHKDGYPVQLSITMSAIRDAEGAVQAIAIIGHDITARKRHEQAVIEGRKRLQDAQALAHIGSWEHDLQTGDVSWSDELYQILGIPLGAPPLPPDQLVERVHFEDRPIYRAALKSATESGQPRECEVRIARTDKRHVSVDARFELRIGPDGRKHMCGTLLDVTERKQAEDKARDYSVLLEYQMRELEQANARLSEIATIDGLTGLKNHRAFQDRLVEEFNMAQRYRRPLSLILLDVDRFKDYNDCYGHPAGDRVLVGVARCLTSSARQTDLVARYGGEEFVVVLPQTDMTGAVKLAERMRKEIQEGTWPNRDITASFGVCTLDPSSTSPSALIAGADSALYRAKAAGRNCVVWLHGSESAKEMVAAAEGAE